MDDQVIELDGHPTWVRDSGGDGPVMLLLHGGMIGSERNFGEMLPHLGSDHRIVMFDRRGHGRTADSDAPFSYAAMAEETAALIGHLDRGPVRAVGYSDGGNLLLDLATSRPELLEAMVLIGANFHHQGLWPAVLEAMDEMGQGSALADAYAAVSPDGAEHWPVVVEKSMTMFRTQPTWSAEDLRVIGTPTLVVAGDDDFTPLSHTCSLYEALPHGQLAVVPGASHLVGWEKPELLGSLITEFLANQEPRRSMPFLRA
jgi:pimeloyl-ACP methyl ester carboxylesterase